MSASLIRRLAVVALLLLVPAPVRAEDKKVRIAMVGDSTMASYPNPPPRSVTIRNSSVPTRHAIRARLPCRDS